MSKIGFNDCCNVNEVIFWLLHIFEGCDKREVNDTVTLMFQVWYGNTFMYSCLRSQKYHHLYQLWPLFLAHHPSIEDLLCDWSHIVVNMESGIHAEQGASIDCTLHLTS